MVGKNCIGCSKTGLFHRQSNQTIDTFFNLFHKYSCKVSGGEPQQCEKEITEEEIRHYMWMVR